MKNIIYLFLFIFSIASCGSSCNRDKDKYEEVVFQFAIPLNISPGVDTISVGQELTLTANFSDSLYDYISQRKYYVPDFKLRTVAVIEQLTNPTASVTEQSPAGNRFSYTGDFVNIGSTFADVNYTYVNGQYSINAKIKATVSGVYIIHFYYSTGTRGSTPLPSALAPSVPGIKRFPLIRQLRYTFNNGDTHFAIYKQHCKPADPNEATNWVESKATYTFVVR